MDLEASLRLQKEFRDKFPEIQPEHMFPEDGNVYPQFRLHLNDEGRAVLTINHYAPVFRSDEFVIVGNTAIPWPIVPDKPPTQRVVITEGILPAPQKGEPSYDPN